MLNSIHPAKTSKTLGLAGFADNLFVSSIGTVHPLSFHEASDVLAGEELRTGLNMPFESEHIIPLGLSLF